MVDNLVSNAKKYADRSEPIRMCAQYRDGYLSVEVSNRIAQSGPRVESTKIGLRTCEKILASLGGVFITKAEDGVFTASFSLPAE